MYELKQKYVGLMVMGIDYIISLWQLNYPVKYILNANKYVDFNNDGTCSLTKYFKNFRLSIYNIGIILQYQHDYYDFVFDTSTNIDLNELSTEFLYTVLVNAMQPDNDNSMYEKLVALRTKLINDSYKTLVDMNGNEIDY